MFYFYKFFFYFFLYSTVLNAADTPSTYKLSFGSFEQSYPIITPKGKDDIKIVYIDDMNDNYALNFEAAKLLASQIIASKLFNTLDVVVVPGDKSTMLASYVIEALKKIKPSIVLCIIRPTNKGGSVEAIEYKSITSSTSKTLHLRKNQAESIKGKNVLLLDDVISTGETIRALRRLVEKVDGKILGYATIATEGDDLKEFDGMPLFKLAHLPVFVQ